MSLNHRGRVIDLISEHWVEVTEIDGLADLLEAYGVDLGAVDGDPAVIQRGTPLFIHEDADSSAVVRRMAEAHVKLLFVLGGRGVIGVVDIDDLIERAAIEAWPPAGPRRKTESDGSAAGTR